VKHVGILAHSVEGAALCLRAFCQEGFEELGPHDHPDVSLDCIALARSMDAWERGDYRTIRDILAESVGRLAAAGAEVFGCPDNTAHLALEEPGTELAMPGIHIVEEVATAAALAGYQSVGVLGTKFTMDGPLYPRALGVHGIDAEIPDGDQRAFINRVIFDELVNGVFSNGSRKEFVAIIESLRRRGCDAVALVCTEIPLLVTAEVSPLPTLDSTRLLSGALFDVAIGKRPMPAWRGGPIGT
jgi:aspartate racemase